jgi:hypothetical protein
MQKKHIGSSFDDFLAEDGRLEEATAIAMRRVIAWRIEQEMKTPKFTKRLCMSADGVSSIAAAPTTDT